MSATSQLRPSDSAQAVEIVRRDWKEGRVATSGNFLCVSPASEYCSKDGVISGRKENLFGT